MEKEKTVIATCNNETCTFWDNGCINDHIDLDGNGMCDNQFDVEANSR